MPISFQKIVKPIPEKGRAPEKGFCIYFPLFPANDNWFLIPEAEQEEVISQLAKRYPNCAIEEGLRAALDDYVFPFQKVILIIEKGRTCVLIHDVKQTDKGEFYFDPDEFIEQFPTLDSVMKEEQVTPRDWLEDWETHLNNARKSHRKTTPLEIEKKLNRVIRAKGFGSKLEGETNEK